MDFSQTQNQVISCKAAICWSPLNQTIDTIEVSPPKRGEVRVGVIACGICGSDNHIYRDTEKTNAPNWPTILGHEAGGIVESVGDEVTSVVIGDHVILLWMPQCDDCYMCNSDETNFCLTGRGVEVWTMRDGTTRLTVYIKFMII
jgi:Zn-dependent alcohol dehydrogenase